MAKDKWIFLGIVVVLVLLFIVKPTREHLTGVTIPSASDAVAYPNSPGSTTFDEWFIPNFPQGGMDTATYLQTAKATLWFVQGYGANYTKATAPLSTTDFYKDFMPIYNTELVAMYDNQVPAPTAVPATDPSQLASNDYANAVYAYYYGPKSKTPYSAPSSSLSPIAPKPASLAPKPSPAPSQSTMAANSAPPASSSSPNQPLTFYIPQPCKTEYKSFPGGSVELRCFD
jgi:hypothetical protein